MTEVDRVLLAAPRSFCAGVEMAIKALAWMVRIFDPPVYCYHQIVHNRSVVDRFERAGVIFVDDIDEVPPGAPLMLSAHGTAPGVVEAASRRSDLVIDAVCPLVQKVHHEVRRRTAAGQDVIYIGHPDHDEAVGTTAVAPSEVRLVEGPADIADLDDLRGPVAFLAQTTLAVEEWQATLAASRQRFGDVWLPAHSDLCFATTNRQAAVRAVAPRCDVLVVVGSENSSNTMALVRVAEQAAATRALRVDGPSDLPPDLVGTVGVTAGASAPEHLVEGVIARLAPREGVEIVAATTEDEYFPPPRQLRDLLRSAGADHLLDGDRSVAASDVLATLDPGSPGNGEGSPSRSARVERSSSPGVAAIDHLAAYSAMVDQEMAAVVAREVTDTWLQSAIGYHLGWRDEQLRLLRSTATGKGGKKLRATLAMLASRAASPKGATAPAPSDELARARLFAAAVELVHNWSLVHDDIQDGDRTRRGRPAMWTVCGIPQAINVGNCIHALAHRCLSGLVDVGVSEATAGNLMAELARSAAELTVGQTQDIAFETATEVDCRSYLAMAEAKTGAVMGCSTHGGALVGGSDPAEADAYRTFGRQLGLAFQIRDDILGIWGTGNATGKPTGSDIRRRKMTLPVVVAFERADGCDREQLDHVYTQDSPPTGAEETAVGQILDRCAARETAQQQARQHRHAALEALDSVVGEPAGDGPSADADAAVALRSLATFVTERTR